MKAPRVSKFSGERKISGLAGELAATSIESLAGEGDLLCERVRELLSLVEQIEDVPQSTKPPVNIAFIRTRCGHMEMAQQVCLLQQRRDVADEQV